MEYLPLFLLFAAALIAGWFYLQRAKARDTNATDSTVTTSTTPRNSADPVATAPPQRSSDTVDPTRTDQPG